MKTCAIATVFALFAGMVAPSFAFDGAAGLRAPSQATRVSCDTRQEDKQAVCASTCEDAFLKDQMSFAAELTNI